MMKLGKSNTIICYARILLLNIIRRRRFAGEIKPPGISDYRNISETINCQLGWQGIMQRPP